METILQEQSLQNFNFSKTKRSFDETFGDQTQMNETFKSSFNFTPNTSSNTSSNIFLPFTNLVNPNNQTKQINPIKQINLTKQINPTDYFFQSFDKKHKPNNQLNNQLNNQSYNQYNKSNDLFNNSLNNQQIKQNQLSQQTEINNLILTELKNMNNKMDKLDKIIEQLCDKINLIEIKLNEIYGDQHRTFSGECSYIN